VRQRAAGQARLAVDQHGAGAAFAAVATLLGAGESERIAQVVDQQCVLGHGVFARPAIDGQSEYGFHVASLVAALSQYYCWMSNSLLGNGFHTGRGFKYVPDCIAGSQDSAGWPEIAAIAPRRLPASGR
jgi:hypothetical protein